MREYKTASYKKAYGFRTEKDPNYTPFHHTVEVFDDATQQIGTVMVMVVPSKDSRSNSIHFYLEDLKTGENLSWLTEEDPELYSELLEEVGQPNVDSYENDYDPHPDPTNPGDMW